MEWWMFAAYAAAAIVLATVQALLPSRVDRAVDRAAQKAGLGVTFELRPLIRRRVRATGLGDLVGCSVGLAVGGLLLLEHVNGPGSANLVVQVAIVIGGGAGGAIGGLVAARRLRPAGRRVARDRAVGVADYISPLERVGIRAGAALCLAVGAVGLLTVPAGTLLVPALCTATGPVVLGAFELLSRRIVGRPQTADSAVELAWDDAFRSSSVRRLGGAAGAVALLAAIAGAWSATHALLPSPQADTVVLVGTAVLVCFLIAARVWLLHSTSSRFFRDRLWPDTVAYIPERAAS